MEGLGLFFLAAISTWGGGIYLRFDHKHLHNIIFFLLPSFHNPWIIVTVINYIDNKRNSIAIHFLCVVINRVGGRGGLVFSYYHNYNNGRFRFVFFVVAISTVGGGIYLRFLSRCSDEEEQHVFDKGWNFDVLELACFTSNLSKGLQEHCNKFIWNCCQSFNVKGNFFFKNSEVNGTWAIHI